MCANKTQSSTLNGRQGGEMAAGSKTARGSYTAVVKKSILGAQGVNAEREDVGTIEDLVIDSRDSRVAYAIVSFGGFLGMGDKHFAIPWQALTLDPSEKIAVLNINKERLTNAPGFDRDNWPDMTDSNWATKIHSHDGDKP